MSRRVAALVAMQLILAASPAFAATFAVNDSGDAADGSTADSVCDADLGLVGGQCTLRAAIEQANATAGGDAVLFDLGPSTLQPASALPFVTERLTIDTAPAEGEPPPILLDGQGQVGAGLTFADTADGSVVNGLAIGRWANGGVVSYADDFTLSGSYIGLDPDGTTARSNAFGVQLGGANPTIEFNVISANANHGLTADGVVGGRIRGNYVGLDATGFVARPNQVGIVLGVDTRQVIVGGDSSADRNVVSGNTTRGILVSGAFANTLGSNYVGTSVLGSTAVPNATGIELNGGAHDNVITAPGLGAGVVAGNTNIGIYVTGAATTANQITTTLVGLNAGAAALPNSSGVRVDNAATGNRVGPGNAISGNASSGVVLTAPGNVVAGNTIGLDPDGSAPRPNGSAGVLIASAGNVVGGTTSADRNLIAGNAGDGVQISGTGSTNNIVGGNWIGLNADGLVRPNGLAGVSVGGDADNNLIGGSDPGARNVISGNLDAGITVTSNTTDSTAIRGNYVGLDAEGDDKAGNGTDGIRVISATGTVIASNVISGHPDAGVSLLSSSASVIRGNRIGTSADGGRAIGNGTGIAINGTATQDVVGGTGAGEGNVITASRLDGVELFGNAARTTIRGNAIFGNSALGIDLRTLTGGDGVSANDDGDADTGANGLQNHPILSSAEASGGSTLIAGSLSTTASSIVSVDVYLSDACDPSGNGEAATFLGSTETTTGPDGTASFSLSVARALPAGQVVTATATSPTGATSEFSGCVVTTAVPPQATGVVEAPPTQEPVKDVAPTIVLRTSSRQLPLRAKTLRATLTANVALRYTVRARVLVAGRRTPLFVLRVRGAAVARRVTKLSLALSAPQRRELRRVLRADKRVTARFTATGAHGGGVKAPAVAASSQLVLRAGRGT